MENGQKILVYGLEIYTEDRTVPLYYHYDSQEARQDDLEAKIAKASSHVMDLVFGVAWEGEVYPEDLILFEDDKEFEVPEDGTKFDIFMVTVNELHYIFHSEDASHAFEVKMKGKHWQKLPAIVINGNVYFGMPFNFEEDIKVVEELTPPQLRLLRERFERGVPMQPDGEYDEGPA